MSHKKDAPGMKGYRPRDEDGTLERKRGDTEAKTIEKKYHVDLGVRSDKQLKNILKDENVDSLSQLLKKVRNE